MEKAIDLREDTGEMPPGTVHHEQGAVGVRSAQSLTFRMEKCHLAHIHPAAGNMALPGQGKILPVTQGSQAAFPGGLPAQSKKNGGNPHGGNEG